MFENVSLFKISDKNDPNKWVVIATEMDDLEFIGCFLYRIKMEHYYYKVIKMFKNTEITIEKIKTIPTINEFDLYVKLDEFVNPKLIILNEERIIYDDGRLTFYQKLRKNMMRRIKRDCKPITIDDKMDHFDRHRKFWDSSDDDE